jgi:hypothetical protein
MSDHHPRRDEILRLAQAGLRPKAIFDELGGAVTIHKIQQIICRARARGEPIPRFSAQTSADPVPRRRIKPAARPESAPPPVWTTADQARIEALLDRRRPITEIAALMRCPYSQIIAAADRRKNTGASHVRS